MSCSKPPAFVPKSFIDRGFSINFSDSNIIHDRVLIVEGRKFHVTSGLLSLSSEFFNGLFNSDFMEKNQEEIELEDIKANDFDNFLRSIYPVEFAVTTDNLPGLMKLSGRFLSLTVWSKCMKFLRNKDQFKKFKTSDLLDWSMGSDSYELKSMIEQDLISGCDSVFGTMININKKLELAVKYNLEQYKAFLGNLLWTSAFQHNLETLLTLAVTYNIDDIKKKVDLRLMILLNTPVSYADIAIVFKELFVVNLVAIKDKIKEMLAVEIKKFTANGCSRFLDEVFKNDIFTEAKSIAEVLLAMIFTNEKDKKTNLLTYLEIASKFQLEFLKSNITDFLENKLFVGRSLEELDFVLDINNTFMFIDVQRKAEKIIVKMFSKEQKKKDIFGQYLKVVKQYSMMNLQDTIEEYLIRTCKLGPLFKLGELISLTCRFELMKMADFIDPWLVQLLTGSNDSPRAIYRADPVEQCDLPNILMYLEFRADNKNKEFVYLPNFITVPCRPELEENVLSFLCLMFKKKPKTDETILRYFNLTKKYDGFGLLEKTISTFLEEEFVEKHSYKHIQWAFDYNLKGFKESQAAGLLLSCYGHITITPITKKMIWTRIIVVLLFYFEVSARQVNISLKPKEYHGKGQTYALLVTGGVRWYPSYRKESNVAAAYALLKKNGVSSENIVVMSYDYAVHHPRNPCKGQLFHTPEFENIYDPGTIDYKGLSVTPHNVLNVLRGDSAATIGGNGRVLNSTSMDRVFVFFTVDGLAMPPALAFQDKTRVWAKDLVMTLQWMKGNGRYSEMVIYLDSDFGNRILSEIPNDLNVYGVTNTNDNVSINITIPTLCGLKHSAGEMACLATKFSSDWQNHTTHSNIYKTTFRDQMAYLREHSDHDWEDYQEALLEFGDKRISEKPIACFLANWNSPLCG